VTLEQFASKTGWPIEELHSMPATLFLEVLSWYDMEMIWKDKETGKEVARFSFPVVGGES